MSNRTRIMTVGCVRNDGVEFQMDEASHTYEWKGRTFLGFGIHKITLDTDGVSKVEELYDVKERTLDALTRFQGLERLVKAGAFKAN